MKKKKTTKTESERRTDALAACIELKDLMSRFECQTDEEANAVEAVRTANSKVIETLSKRKK